MNSMKGGESNMNSKILMVVVAIVLVAAGFFGGMQYQKSQVPSFAGGQEGFRQRMMGQGQEQRTGQNFNSVRGSILSIDANTMTVKLQDGSSKIVVLSSSTTYMKEAAISKGDLKTGDTIMVIGASNSDGSVTAQNVQINPIAIRGATPSAR
jgi:hypothetical protein